MYQGELLPIWTFKEVGAIKEVLFHWSHTHHFLQIQVIPWNVYLCESALVPCGAKFVNNEEKDAAYLQ